MKARIHVTPREGVLDPQGAAVERALHGLGFTSVAGVRQGKYFEIDLPGADPAAARAEVVDMCERLLANTVVEDYEVDIEA